LTAAVEEVEQARLALGPLELILFLHGEPRHPPTFGGQRVTGAGQSLLLHEKLLARRLPLLRRYDKGGFPFEMPFPLVHVSLLVRILHHSFRSRSNLLVAGHEIDLAPRMEPVGVTSVAGFREPALAAREKR